MRWRWGCVVLLLLLASLPTFAAKVAVLIGCNGYEAEVFPQLYACVADVQRMQGTLKEAGYEVYTLTDDALGPDGKRNVALYSPDKRNIEKKLRVVAAGNLGKGDTLLFYFSGHGVRAKDGDDYLAPIDAADIDPAHLVKVNWVYETMRLSGAENIVIITDACRVVHGKDGGDVANGFGKASAEELQQLDAREQRYALLRSCTEGQKSYERDDHQGGWFTYYLAEGLAGAADGWSDEKKDGVITVGKAFAYAKAKVGEMARQANEVQVPQLNRTGEQVDDIPLAGAVTPVTPDTALTLRVTAPGEAADGKEISVAGDSVTIAGVVTDLPGVKVNYLGIHPDDVPLRTEKDLRTLRSFSYTVSDLSPGLNTLVFEAVDVNQHRQQVTVHVRCPGSRRFTDLAQRVAAAKDGDTIELAEGEYLLSEQLTITKSIALVGAGQDKTLIRATSKGAAIYMDANYELFLKNLTIRQASGFPADVISVKAGVTTIRQCNISGGILNPTDNTCGFGICATGSAHCNVFDSLLQGNESCGIALFGNSEGKVVNTQCKESGLHGIYASDNSTLTAESNTCLNNKYHGIVLSGASRGKLLSNLCKENEWNGILAEGNSTLTAESNICQNNKYSGIALTDSSQGNVVNNVCKENAYQGIAAFHNSTLTATGNTCQNNKQGGILFYNKAKGTQVDHNTCTGNKWGIYTAKETTVTLQENTCTDNTAQNIRQDK